MNTVPRVLVGGPLDGTVVTVDHEEEVLRIDVLRMKDEGLTGTEYPSVIYEKHTYRAGRHGDERMVYEGGE